MVPPTVAIIGVGEMGAAIGALLVAGGARVVTCLKGRSKASASRAIAAGIEALPNDRALVKAADVILSILPPDRAVELAERLATAIAATKATPIYVDCNAVAPKTSVKIGQIVTRAGARFVDGGIIGPAPVNDSANTRVFLSGDDAEHVRELSAYGVDFRVLAGGVGAASALKMCNAMLTKGAAALAFQAFAVAHAHGVAAPLHAELTASQPAVVAAATRQGRSIGRKAYRWIGEMEEIATTLRDAGLWPRIFLEIADVYRRIDATSTAADLDAVARGLLPSRQSSKPKRARRR